MIRNSMTYQANRYPAFSLYICGEHIALAELQKLMNIFCSNSSTHYSYSKTRWPSLQLPGPTSVAYTLGHRHARYHL